MDNKKFSVVVVGQITLDDIILPDAPPLPDNPGGSGLYSLSGAYMWHEGKYGLVVRRGEDFDMSRISSITGSEIDFSGVVSVPNVSNVHIFAMFDRMGNRYFINQRWSGKDKDMAPVPADIPQEYICEAKAVHISAFPIFWEKDIILSLPDRGSTDLVVQVDPHFDGVYSDNRELWKQLFKKITIFQPSEDELTRMFSIEKSEDPLLYVPYMKQVTELGPRVCTCKIGGKGVLVYDSFKDICFHVPAYDKTEIVDVTGCGDAFCGGFLTSFIRDGDVFTAALKGSVSASFNLEHYGCLDNFNIPYEAVAARYAEFANLLDREKCMVK